MGIESIWVIAAKYMLPALTSIAKIIRNITDWFIKNPALVKTIVVIAGIAAAVIACKAAVALLTGAVAWLSKNLLGTPIGWIIAGLTALYLLVEDFYTFLQGGDSVIGRLLQRWGYDLDVFRAGFQQWCDDIKAKLNNLLAFFDKSREHMMTSEERLNQNSLKDDFTPEQQNKINEFNRKKMVEQSRKDMEGKNLTMSAQDTGLIATIQRSLRTRDAMKKAKADIQAANNNPYNSISTPAANNINTTNNTTSNKKVVQINTVNIQTQASDPKGVAREVSNVAEYDNGLRA